MRGEGIELCKRIELERNCNYNDRAFPFYLVRIIHSSVWGLIENKTARGCGSVFGVYTRRRLTVRVNRNPLNYLELAKSAAATSERVKGIFKSCCGKMCEETTRTSCQDERTAES